VAEQRIRPTAQHGRQPNAALVDAPPPDRIDAPVHGMQPLRPDAPIDRPATHPKVEQLKASDHAMLPIGQLGDPRIPANARFFINAMNEGAWAVHRPILAVVR
jgi:hypothetical protein